MLEILNKDVINIILDYLDCESYGNCIMASKIFHLKFDENNKLINKITFALNKLSFYHKFKINNSRFNDNSIEYKITDISFKQINLDLNIYKKYKFLDIRSVIYITQEGVDIHSNYFSIGTPLIFFFIREEQERFNSELKKSVKIIFNY